MADVYEGAVITIAATWSSSSEDGCFAPAMHDIALSEGGLYFRDDLVDLPRRTWESRLSEQWPLFQRAWVYQERRLSTRVLHFGKQQLFWECSSKLRSENNLEGSYHTADDLKSLEVEEDPGAGWRNVVTHYSRLRLTHEKDRLPAISAIVKRMQRVRKGDVYIAGMWKRTLPHDLCWFTRDGQELARPDRPGTVMPSWSWISTSSEALYSNGLEPELSPDDIFVVHNITGPAHIGQVSHASIRLKARFMLVKPILKDRYPFETLEDADGTWGNDGLPVTCFESGWDFDFTTANPPICIDETFVSVLLSWLHERHYFGIVLREVANKQFERVGYVDFRIAKDESVRKVVASLPVGQFTIV